MTSTTRTGRASPRNALIQTVIRGSVTLSRIVWYLINASVTDVKMALSGISHAKRQKRRALESSRHASALLDFLGFTCRFHHAERLAGIQGGALVVCNHLSFWDMLVLSSRFPLLYITSVEVRNTPVLGRIARLAGSVFVERRSRDRIGEEITEIQEELEAGQSVALFPEGTSGDGTRLLPFKRSLFRAAINTGRPVVPICINYREIDGRALDASTRDRLFYYGDQTFGAQLARIFQLKKVIVDVDILEPIRAEKNPLAHQEVCEESYLKIGERFSPIMGPTIV